MAPTFIFPPNLHFLEQHSDDTHQLSVHSTTNIATFRASDLEEFVKGVSFDLSDKELFCIEDQDVFDRVYSLIKCYSSLTPACKFNIVETLRSNFSVLLPNIDSLSRVSNAHQNDNDDEDSSLVHERVVSHRNAFKIYTFFLVHIVLAEESSSASNNVTSKTAASNRKKLPINAWKWEGQRGRILTLIANSLEINLSMLFGSSDPDENYLSFITKNAFLMFENPILLKDSDAKDALCRIIGSCATKYHYLAQTSASIIHMLHKYDFVVTAMADAVAMAEKKYADGSLATSIIREVGRTNPKNYAKDTAGAENIGRFLVELSERLPKLISTNIGILVPHFGGESYKIRNALVGVLGKLVSKAFKDDEGEVSSKSVRLRTKQAMLEILLERCRDVSAYTRSRVLQVWSELCEEHSVSIGLWNEVAIVAAGRLEDKSAIVRKSALNLLIVMLQHNPFGPQLRMSTFEATLDKYKSKLSALQPEVNGENEIDGAPPDKGDCNGDGEVDHVNSEAGSDELPNSVTDSYLSQVEEGNVLKDNSVPDVGNVEQTRVLVASLEAGLSFSKCLSSTMPTLVQLMASSSATDVENTILLLMRCRQFQIDGSEACLRKMLPLVFSQDKAISEAVENAFITIYVTKNSQETAKNLLNLAIDSNIGDLAALESIIGALVFKGDVASGAISALWDFFCFNLPRTTAEQCRGALTVLSMAAKSSSEILSSHLQDIIDIGFGRWAKVDPLLARTACTILQRLSEEDRKKLLANNGGRIFGTLESLITGLWLPENIWYSAADKAIGAIYALHPAPEIIAARVIKKSQAFVFSSGDSGSLQHDMENENVSVHGPTTVQAGKLSRYLFVISHVAMHQLVYIESCVRKIQKQKAKKERQNADSSSLTPDAAKDGGINAELGVSASDDAILDSLADKAEREILSGGSDEKNMLGYCAPFLSKLCRNFSLMQKNPELQAAAMLALCRFMIVDAAFCEANLQLLFTVVESTSSETVRSNCTIALGDLAVRFPNLLEPWTEHMYSRLRDKSVTVRKNAVLVLSHLILNEMMKVKGYIYEMAVILEDEDERISNLAKLFFTELAKKGKLVKLGLILLIRVVQNMAMGGRVMMNKTPKLELVGKLVKDSRSWWRGFVSTTPSPRMIEQLKIDYLSAKIEVEEEIGAPETPPNYLERCMSRDLGVLKDLLKDYKNLNKKISKDVRRKKVAEFKTTEQKRKDIHLPLFGFGPPVFTAHHPQAADIATRIVQSYNRQQNSNFELRRVVDVVQDRYPLDSHFLVEACDRDASSVTIKLQAIYRTCGKEIRQLHAPQPVPFMKLLQSNKTTALSFDERQTLLYANVTNCPIIAKRLGLKGRDELHHELLSRLGINFSTLPLLEQDVDETFVPFKASSISVVKLSLDDLILPSLAHFAVNEWNETQGSLHIRFSRVVGAWREYMMADRYIYHLMIEALDNGVKRRFYSAFVPEPNLDDVELVDWVSTDFRNTITIN